MNNNPKMQNKQRFYEVLHLLKTPTSLFNPRIMAAVLRKEIATHLPKNVKPFMFGTYPSTLFLSDIPVQGLIAAHRQAEKQRQPASQLHVPAARAEYTSFAQIAGEEVAAAKPL